MRSCSTLTPPIARTKTLYGMAAFLTLITCDRALGYADTRERELYDRSIDRLSYDQHIDRLIT